jgi:hypothetical protein
MRPNRAARPAFVLTLLALTSLPALAQDIIKLNVNYVCSGERLYVESCNIRDTSPTSTCQVAHPDRPQHNGFMAYTTETRATLTKLLPTCTQPTAQQLAAQQDFQKRQQAALAAETAKYNPTPAPTAAPSSTQSGSAAYSAVPPPKNAEEQQMRRCVSSGRLPSSCTGNALLGAFSGMISSALSGLTGTKDPNSPDAPPAAGPVISGVFQGAGNWRLDFVDGGVLVNCAGLSPNQEAYSLSLANNRATLTIKTTPRPLVLTVHPDGAITGPPGAVTINGVVATGYVDPNAGSGATQKDQYGNLYNAAGQRVAGNANTPGYSTFSPRTATCPAINLTKGASVGIQTMETNLLKSAFGGDTGPATPAGIRMTGIFASASTGFSAQFFPESVILGCGPDAARAYPYTVVADGTKSVVAVAAPDKPLTLAFRPDGSLDPGNGTYQVHGRIVTGQDDNDNFTFAPMERTCNLATLTPSKTIPTAAGSAGVALATASAGLSTPDKPLGNATLAITSSLAGSPNPLANHPYVLLRDTYANSLANAGISVPVGQSPYLFVGVACAAQPRTAQCQNILAAINSSAASAVRADATGIFPGVPPGTYFLMISGAINGQPMVWSQAVTLHTGANSLTLSAANAQPMK